MELKDEVFGDSKFFMIVNFHNVFVAVVVACLFVLMNLHTMVNSVESDRAVCFWSMSLHHAEAQFPYQHPGGSAGPRSQGSCKSRIR